MVNIAVMNLTSHKRENSISRPPHAERELGGEVSTLRPATDSPERARPCAEIDGLVAHIYGLSEAEFVHILGTFPPVPEVVKAAAVQSYRELAGKGTA